MLLLTILDIIFQTVSSILGVVLPSLPPEIDSYLIQIFNMIENGLDIVFTVFLNREIVVSIFHFIADTWLVLFGVDLVWRIINTIKGRHDHQEAD